MEHIKPDPVRFVKLLPARQTQFERMLETLRTTMPSTASPRWTPPSLNRRRSSGQRAADGETDLPLHQGGQRPGPSVDLTVPLAKYGPHWGPGLPLPPVSIGKVYRERD
ncbi:MAG: hypothetical protein ACLS43_04615 [Evtepia gabavorous]